MREKATATWINEAREEDEFEVFFQQNYKRVYAVLYRLTGEKMEAEDLTVETFLRYFRRPPENKDQAAGWLYRVATRLGYNALRASKRRSHYEEKAALYVAGGASDPLQEVERAREQMRVHAVLRKMDERNAEILVLHHSGFSYKEIAEAIGVSPNSIGTLLSRAQKEFERIYLGG
ncbi:sigma-70 family RNA polymerase sigma factor [bacterium]|nr:sigma-70 family RNA polymerase sigma factor [bacterium]MCI0604496.1 sigma-70 family RNA polymerase sigma factor [bacterium]